MVTPEGETPYIDFVILADRAEVHAGKLYIMGGCWERATFPEFPAGYPCGIAARVVLPAGWPQLEGTVRFELKGPAGAQLVPNALRFQRQAPSDRAAQFVMAVGVLATFREPGDYRLVANLDDVSSRALEFRVEADAVT